MSLIRLPILLAAIAASAFLAGCGSGPDQAGAAAISADELVARVQAGTAPLVLDVRSEDEYRGGHIPGAVNIPHDELAARIAELPSRRSTEIVVHCQSGRRAGLAEAVLRENGYSNVRDLEGHWQGWQASQLPTE
jgi:rhodanese-related sulfurtransferase